MVISQFLSSLSVSLMDAATSAGNVDAAAAELAEGEGASSNILTSLVSFLPLVLIIVAFYFFLIRPQRKQEKETQKMRNSIEIDDQVTTIGGIQGIVRQIKDDDTYIIETGADKNRITIKKWAIQSKDTVSDK